MAITTVDGIVKKRNETVWEVGINMQTRTRMPCRSRVYYDNIVELNAFSTYALCEAECKRRDERDKKEKS